MRKLPPLNSIRVFEAAAEKESFAAAADELGVTKGAVSQQIRVLEEYMGQPLFDREGRGLNLNDTGRRYHSAVRNALNILERETARYISSQSPSMIRLSVLPAFASLWLVPRLGEFQKLRKNVEFQLSADAAMVDFNRSDCHIGIRYGLGDVHRCYHKSLGYDQLFPVCSSAYMQKMNINTIEDIAHCRLLHDTYWQDDWPTWAAVHNVDLPNLSTGQHFSHYSLAVDAARSDAGIVMAHKRLLSDILSSGELVPVSDRQVQSQHPYYVVHPERVSHLSNVKEFVSWLSALWR